MIVSSGSAATVVPRVTCSVILLTGKRTPPAAASASSSRSARGPSGTRTLLPTSPTTVTLDETLRSMRTSTCGWLALPFRRRAISCSISTLVRPSTVIAPANGTLIVPSRLTTCSGRLTAREVLSAAPLLPLVGVPEPNSVAGGASQMLTSIMSPVPTSAGARIVGGGRQAFGEQPQAALREQLRAPPPRDRDDLHRGHAGNVDRRGARRSRRGSGRTWGRRRSRWRAPAPPAARADAPIAQNQTPRRALTK